MEIRVRPIHNEADYERTLSEVEALMDAEPGTPRGERLDVLVTLVEAYEARHWPIGNPDPIDAIRLRMKQKNLRQRDLVPMIGSRGRVSEILARKRSLTLPMIRRLARELDIRPDVLIQETPLTRPRHAEAGRRGESTKRSD